MEKRPSSAMIKSEAQIKCEIRIAIGEEVTIWAQPGGVGKAESGNTIRFGLCNGSSDLIGIRNRDGKFVAIEVKTPKGLRDHQQALERALNKRSFDVRISNEETRAFSQWNFIQLVVKRNGLAGFATSTEEALEIVRG